jgi:hypothetical protein
MAGTNNSKQTYPLDQSKTLPLAGEFLFAKCYHADEKKRLEQKMKPRKLSCLKKVKE